MQRPSESLSAAVGSIIGAIFILIGATTSVEMSSEVQGAVIVLVSWVAAGVTWYVARRQRSGGLASAVDGTVAEATLPANPK